MRRRQAWIVDTTAAAVLGYNSNRVGGRGVVTGGSATQFFGFSGTLSSLSLSALGVLSVLSAPPQPSEHPFYDLNFCCACRLAVAGAAERKGGT